MPRNVLNPFLGCWAHRRNPRDRRFRYRRSKCQPNGNVFESTRRSTNLRRSCYCELLKWASSCRLHQFGIVCITIIFRLAFLIMRNLKFIREPHWPVATVSKIMKHTHTHQNSTKVTCATEYLRDCPSASMSPAPLLGVLGTKTSTDTPTRQRAQKYRGRQGRCAEEGNAVQRTEEHHLHEAHRRRRRGIICATDGHTASSATTAGEGGDGGEIIASSAREGGAIYR